MNVKVLAHHLRRLGRKVFHLHCGFQMFQVNLGLPAESIQFGKVELGIDFGV